MIYSSCTTLRTLRNGSCGIFLIIGNPKGPSSPYLWLLVPIVVPFRGDLFRILNIELVKPNTHPKGPM